MMSLDKVFVTTVWFASGAALGELLKTRYGAAGFILGFIGGTIVAFLITWTVLASRYLLFFPFPLCRRGNCRSFRDYNWPKGTIYGWQRNGFRYRCRCGDQYFRDKNRFMEILPDGTMRPYKRYERGEWVDEATAQDVLDRHPHSPNGK